MAVLARSGTPFFDGLFRLMIIPAGDAVAASAPPDVAVVDGGLFKLMTPDEAGGVDDGGLLPPSVQSGDDAGEPLPLRPLAFFPDIEVSVASEPAAAPVVIPPWLLPFFLLELFFLEDGVAPEPVAVIFLFAPPPPVPTPGSDVISVNWLPSAIGPRGFALHEPWGETELDIPKGIVP